MHKRATQFLNCLINGARRDALRSPVRSKAVLGRGDEEEINFGVTGDGDGPKEGCCSERLALVVSHGGLLGVMMHGEMDLGGETLLMRNCSVTVVDVFEKEEGGGGGRGAVSYVPRVVDDGLHLEAAGLTTASYVEFFSSENEKTAGRV